MKSLVAAFILLVVCAPAQAQPLTEYDSGPILSLSEGLIHVRGNKGDHILEPIGVCTWCEVDLEVLITFRGYTRVTLRPYVSRSSRREIKAFLLRDGRP